MCEHHDTAQPTSSQGTRHELWKHSLLGLLLCLGTWKGCTQEVTCTLGVGKFARRRKSMTEGRNSICRYSRVRCAVLGHRILRCMGILGNKSMRVDWGIL